MRFIDFIRDRARYYNCPVCGRSLRGCDLRMLQQVEDRYTVQVTCAACHVQFIVVLAVQGDSLQAGLDDDLELEVELAGVEEAAELASAAGFEAPTAREPVQLDEVLDVHLLLKDFKGSLADLFRQPSADRR